MIEEFAAGLAGLACWTTFAGLPAVRTVFRAGALLASRPALILLVGSTGPAELTTAAPVVAAIAPSRPLLQWASIGPRPLGAQQGQIAVASLACPVRLQAHPVCSWACLEHGSRLSASVAPTATSDSFESYPASAAIAVAA